MISPVSLHFQPPEPPADRDWPPFVRLDYGQYERLYDSGGSDPYPLQWTGWLIRYAHHVLGLLHDGLDRTSDEAVLAAATLKDLAEDLNAADDELARELLLDVQGLLLARLRTCQLPTTPDLYSVTEAAAVLDRWVSAGDDVHTEAARLLRAYLEDVHSVLGRARVQQIRRTNIVQDQTPQEMREATILQLRQLLADVETGTLDLREVSVTRRGTLETVTLQGRRTGGVVQDG